MDSFSLRPFIVSRNTILRTLLLSPSAGWPIWLVFLIGVVMISIGIFFDIRCVIMGLMVWLVIIPALLFFISVNHMFAPNMMPNLLNHTVERVSNGYMVHIYRPAYTDNDEDHSEAWIESGSILVLDDKVVKRKLTDDYEELFLKDAPIDILYVPRQ